MIFFLFILRLFFDKNEHNTYTTFQGGSNKTNFQPLSFRNTVEVRETREITYTFDGKTARLKIINTKVEASGIYKIVFTNSAGSDESSTELRVNKKVSSVKDLGAFFLLLFFRVLKSLVTLLRSETTVKKYNDINTKL